MSEDLNLPASLERLEINPERHDKVEEEKVISKSDDSYCSLESLSLNAVCPKESCQCNKKKESRDRDKGVKRLGHKRPILRRSKLSPAVLRAPILKLPTPKESPGSQVAPDPTKELSRSFQTKTDTPSCSTGPPTYSTGEYVSRIPLETLNRIQTEQRSNAQNCCAVQARIALESSQAQSAVITDDTNIDELASYFDLFVHIPKKMSQMAEMMYI